MTALRLLLPALLVVLADQLIKVLSTKRLAAGRSVHVASGVELRYTTNSPRSRPGPRRRAAWAVLWGSSLAGLMLLMRYGDFFAHPVAQMGLGGALGGAASNLYDRLRHGAVIDLVKIGWWPVFNLADVGITLGVVAALWFLR